MKNITNKTCMTDSELFAICFYAKQAIKRQITFDEKYGTNHTFEDGLLEIINDTIKIMYRTPAEYFKIEELKI